MIKTIFTDIGGVLLTNGWDRKARQRAAQQFALDGEELNERHHLTFDTYEEGKLSLDEYLSRTVFYQKRTFSLADFKTFMFAQSQPLDEMLHFMRELKASSGLRMAAVSNEGRDLTIHRVQTFQLTDFIDFFIVSSFVHLRKPDHDIFKLALDTAQAKAAETLYIDDRAMFVEVARSLGIHAIHHVDAATTRQALAEYGAT